MWTAANYKLMGKLNQLMDHKVINKKSGAEKGEWNIWHQGSSAEEYPKDSYGTKLNLF